MTIEEEIFKKTKIDYNKIEKYGFKKDKDSYKYSKNIMNDNFRIDIEINKKGTVKGKIIDLSFNEEYTSFRIEENIGSFISEVKNEFKNLLLDIKDKCFIRIDFIYNQTNRIAKLIKEKYDSLPEFEWAKSPGFAVFRNKESKKWYGIVMNIDKSKLDKKTNGEVEIINIKLAPSKIENLLKLDGFYEAYHMNKKSWISIILNDTLKDTEIMKLIEESYSYTVIDKKPNEWLIPANPKYFDIEKALKENNTIMWKQSTNIKKDDIVYLYVTEPYSSIMYKFKVIEVSIPYQYKDKNLKMNRIMKIKLIKRYEKGKYSFSILKEFKVNAVRGPRYMPVLLSEYINK